MRVRLQRSAGCCNRKQYRGAVDHVTLPRQRGEREREHNDTGYQSLPRSTPVDARPAGAAVENETSARNLSGRSASAHQRDVDTNVSYMIRRNDVGNHRTSLDSRPNSGYLRISKAFSRLRYPTMSAKPLCFHAVRPHLVTSSGQ